MSESVTTEPEDGWYQDADGRVFYMKWYVEYGMRVFQLVPDAEEEEVIGKTLYFLETVVKDLSCVGDHKYAAKSSLHIQFSTLKKDN